VAEMVNEPTKKTAKARFGGAWRKKHEMHHRAQMSGTSALGIVDIDGRQFNERFRPDDAPPALEWNSVLRNSASR